ncbi:MAG: DNA adenine methylase, partial [Promethearchaeota archaeon]
VGLALKRQSKIISNDVQYFSYVLGKAYIENNKYEKIKTIPIKFFKKSLKYNIFEKYFSNTYFTKQQCIEIDNIWAFIDNFKLVDEYLFYCYLTCLLQSLDLVARTAGHFDGSLKNNTKKVILRQNKSVYEEFNKKVKQFTTIRSIFKNKCYNLPAETLLREVEEVDLIYIDPPYNHRQYSRYYHLLETCARYDSNINLNTKGLYRLDGFKSDFCFKSKVKKAFENIISLSIKKAKKKIIISYTNLGLINKEDLLRILENFSLKVKLFEKRIKYTRQKTSKSNRVEKELLYVCSV